MVPSMDGIDVLGYTILEVAVGWRAEEVIGG